MHRTPKLVLAAAFLLLPALVPAYGQDPRQGAQPTKQPAKRNVQIIRSDRDKLKDSYAREKDAMKDFSEREKAALAAVDGDKSLTSSQKRAKKSDVRKDFRARKKTARDQYAAERKGLRSEIRRERFSFHRNRKETQKDPQADKR